MTRTTVFLATALLTACTAGTDDDGVDTDTDETDIIEETDVADVCGDGTVTGDEVCDDGDNDGGEGECLAGCGGLQECGDGDIEGTEECDDGNTDIDDGCDDTCAAEGDVMTADVDILCSLGEQTLTVPVEIIMATNVPWTVGGTVDVNTRIVSTITPSIGDIVLLLNQGDTVTVSGLDLDLDIVGTDVATISLTSTATPFAMDFDIDDDTMADPYDLTTDTLTTTMTSDGSATVEATLSGLSVNLTDVPILLTLDLVVPTTDPKSPVDCALPDPNTPVTFTLQ